MNDSSVVVIIDYRAQPGQEVALRDELTTLITTVVETERDCTGIELVQSADDAAHFVLYERWSSREAYTGPHMQTPHIKAFIARAPAFVAGPPVIAFFSPVAVR